MVGRKGQSVVQPYYHFIKLLGKDEVISSTATHLTRWAPALALAATLGAALFIPLLYTRPVLSFDGDFLLVVYLLAMAKGIMALAAMDSGSSFEGMGASREMSFTAFLEPAFMLVVASLIYSSGLRSLAALTVTHNVDFADSWSVIVAGLTAIALYIMLLVESSRVPFDDPSTHLELTMIHEVMILDYSGFSLALIHYTAALKLLIYASLIAHLLIPATAALAGLWYLLIILGVAVFTGILESSLARFRMNRNLELVLIPVSLSLLALAALIAKGIGGW